MLVHRKIFFLELSRDMADKLVFLYYAFVFDNIQLNDKISATLFCFISLSFKILLKSISFNF